MGKISRDCDEDVTSGKSWSSRCCAMGHNVSHLTFTVLAGT